jgi:hypothetical protein
MESCVAAINGGVFNLHLQYQIFSIFIGCVYVEHSTLSDSLKLQGVVAQGLNSKVFINNSRVFDCSGTCILALQGGCIDILQCKIFASTTMQGVCAQGKGSKITIKCSQIYGIQCKDECCVHESFPSTIFTAADFDSCRLHANLCRIPQW